MATRSIDGFVSELIVAGVPVKKDVPGESITTYRVGGNISYLVEINSLQDVQKIAEIIEKSFVGQLTNSNVATIGNGSNIIVADTGFNGCIFRIGGELAEIQNVTTLKYDKYNVEVGSGTSLPVFSRQCASKGISGLEFYVGIPGTVGGAVAMNAGGHGKQTSEVLTSCEVLNLQLGIVEKFNNDACDFSYRHSRFVSTDLVFSARFDAGSGDPEKIKKSIDEIVQWRRDFQPGGRNVGSVFQNPIGKSAGQLIEESDLKGVRIGGAHVSTKHANFIQADEGASAKDVIDLIEHIKRVVYEITGQTLSTEVRYVGNYGYG